MTLSRTDEIRQVASRAARLLKELLRRVDELERGIGQMRLIAGLPLPPDVAAKVRRLLEWNGCECECEHHWEDHDDDCDRCLACRIGEAVGK